MLRTISFAVRLPRWGHSYDISITYAISFSAFFLPVVPQRPWICSYVIITVVSDLPPLVVEISFLSRLSVVSSVSHSLVSFRLVSSGGEV